LTILRQQHEGYCDLADCVLASKINAMRALMSDLARVALTSNFGAVEETQTDDDAAISHEGAATTQQQQQLQDDLEQAAIESAFLRRPTARRTSSSPLDVRADAAADVPTSAVRRPQLDDETFGNATQHDCSIGGDVITAESAAVPAVSSREASISSAGRRFADLVRGVGVANSATMASSSAPMLPGRLPTGLRASQQYVPGPVAGAAPIASVSLPSASNVANESATAIVTSSCVARLMPCPPGPLGTFHQPATHDSLIDGAPARSMPATTSDPFGLKPDPPPAELAGTPVHSMSHVPSLGALPAVGSGPAWEALIAHRARSSGGDFNAALAVGTSAIPPPLSSTFPGAKAVTVVLPTGLRAAQREGDDSASPTIAVTTTTTAIANAVVPVAISHCEAPKAFELMMMRGGVATCSPSGTASSRPFEVAAVATTVTSPAASAVMVMESASSPPPSTGPAAVPRTPAEKLAATVKRIQEPLPDVSRSAASLLG
jgi:hypothetical protein